MEHYLQPAMEYLRHHPGMGILFTFLIALIESLPILGTLFPGSVTMTAIGGLIGAAVMPPVITCIAAVVGAFSGDCLGFWLGRRYHERIRQLWPVNKLHKYMEYSEKFFNKHGGKSIIIGRFIGPTRSAMPMIAGILRLTWKQFFPAAILAALLWSILYITPGIILGALALEFTHGDMTRVFIYGLALIVGLWLVFWLLQYFFRQLSRTINHHLKKWWRWLSMPTSGLFVRLIRNQQRPLDYRQLKLTILFLITTLLFILVLINVINQGFLTGVNQYAFYLIQSFRTPGSDRFWTMMTILGTPQALLIASLAIAIGLVILKQWRAGIHFIGLAVIAAIAVEFIKKMVHSPRPNGFNFVELSSSFPSGHTTMSVVVFGFLAFLTRKIITHQWRRLNYSFFMLVILLISFSRLFLGQHWVTDILGAWLLGLSLLILTIVSFARTPTAGSIFKISKKKWFNIVIVSCLIPWIAAIFLSYQKILAESQPIWPKVVISSQEWWHNPTQSVALYRQDRFGRLAQPFNVQWAGNITEIQNILKNHGWLPNSHNLRLLSWLYQDKPPAMFFIKSDQLELRLWDSGVKFSDTSVPLWIGILTYHTPPEKKLRFPRTHVHLQSSNRLIATISESDHFEFQIQRIPSQSQPKRIRALHWDGEIFIITLMY